LFTSLSSGAYNLRSESFTQNSDPNFQIRILQIRILSDPNPYKNSDPNPYRPKPLPKNIFKGKRDCIINKNGGGNNELIECEGLAFEQRNCESTTNKNCPIWGNWGEW